MRITRSAEFKTYPGAPRGFHADYRANYRKDAAEDARKAMQVWFKKYGRAELKRMFKSMIQPVESCASGSS